MSLISEFSKLLEGSPIPERFKLWCGIAMIAGVLERRVWVDVGVGPIYPNMFILLVAPPGTGKSIPINIVARVWREVGEGGLHVAPDNFTKPAFLDKLALSSRTFTNPYTGEMEVFHSLLVASPEFGNFMPAHDTDFLNVLNSIYDAGHSYEEERRSSASVKITRPIVTILGGTQPDFLGSLLPDEAWGMGFTSRLVLVYAGEKRKTSLKKEGRKGAKVDVKAVAADLAPLCKVSGQMEWDEDAWNAFTEWYYDRDEEPRPKHPRLRHYNSRRMVTLCKLATVAAFDEGTELRIRKAHFDRALRWLESAEEVMPEIFKEMASQSEHDVIADIHHWLWQRYMEKGNKPVPTSLFFQMAQRRIPVQKINFVMDLMKDAEIIKVGPNGIVPQTWKELDI